jgi:hypothetical protein
MRACRPVKKLVIDVDNLEDAGDKSLPSPAADIASLSFTLWNAANALVTESVARPHLSSFRTHLQGVSTD